MRIVMISDMHSNLDFKLPEADLLLIAGDICPAYGDKGLSIDLQYQWLQDNFRPWLNQQPVKEVVFIAGNHDWIFEIARSYVPFLGDNCHYLEDSFIDIMGIKIYGTPQQPIFCDWAFNRTEEQLKRYFENIPTGLDILISHCPPYGILDEVGISKRPRKIGSKSLRDIIRKRKPKIVVFGHNHDRYGIEEKYGIKFINCSLLRKSVV